MTTMQVPYTHVPLLIGDNIWRETAAPPALSPKIVISSGFPPNLSILFFTQLNAATWSFIPIFPWMTASPVLKNPGGGGDIKAAKFNCVNKYCENGTLQCIIILFTESTKSVIERNQYNLFVHDKIWPLDMCCSPLESSSMNVNHDR